MLDLAPFPTRNEIARNQLSRLGNDYWRIMGFLNQPLVSSKHTFSLDEVTRDLTNTIRRHVAMAKANHWGYDPVLLLACWERMLLARYLRRFGRKYFVG